MENRDLYLAAYDITEAKRLRDALNVLKGVSTGGQKSVFECFLNNIEKKGLLSRVGRILDPAEDRFLLLRLDPRARVHTLGIGVEPSDPPFFYFG
ncbi:MAG: CRISPR-associated endonuclease Cas2 [Deltaproteobacteria bacterium]